MKVEKFGDYLASEETCIGCGKVKPIDLPRSDVLAFRLEEGASVIIRPSGTEPKIKAYYTTIAETRAEAEAVRDKIADDFKKDLGF